MRSDACLSDLALDLAIDRGAPSASEAAHLESCAACRARMEELRGAVESFRAQARPAAFADAVAARRRPRRWWLAIAPLAAAAAAVALFLRAPDEERVKGAPAMVELYVKSGERADPFDAQRRYRAGDVLQVVYSSTAPLHLAAIDLEENGQATLLYAEKIAPARRKHLDRSFVLDEGAGAERVFLVFSETPLAEARLLDAARAAGVSSSRLELPAVAQTSFLIKR